MEDRRVNFLGADIDLYSMAETIRKVEECIKGRKISQHVVVNVAKLVYMLENKELAEAVNSCDIINVDGMGVVWGARFLGVKIPERIAGIDLMGELVSVAQEKGYGVYFFGATKEVVTRVVSIYASKYPNLRVSGYRDGYFSEDEEKGIISEIKASGADMLFLAIPSPRKEIFLKKYLKQMQVPFVMGVGGSFDVVAGKVKRAPKWMQDNCLEWAWRLMQEPRRMFARYFITNSKFIWLLLKNKFNKTGK